jgi:hypothetical protein
MKRALLIFSVLFFMSVPAGHADAELYYLTPVEDTIVHSYSPLRDTNYGDWDDVQSWVDYGSWVIRFYLMFDFTAIPSGETIDSITLFLYQANGTGFSPGVFLHYVPDDTWDENTVTWNLRPNGGDFQSPEIASREIPMLNIGWATFELLTENWDPDFVSNGYLTLMGKESEKGDSGHSFYSKDYSEEDKRPVLIVQTESVCECDVEPDSDIDGTNLAVFLADYGRTDCDVGELCEGDVEGDNDVDLFDLAVFARDFGRSDCPSY